MAKKKPDAGADYRAAKAGVESAVRDEVIAELAMLTDREAQGWFRLPLPRPPAPDAVLAWEAACERTRWCKALVVACGEVVKGKPFEECI